MAALERARQFKRQGLINDALAALVDGATPSHDRLSVDVLRAELLELSAQYASAALLGSKLSAERLTPSQRSRVEIVMGRVAMDSGDLRKAADHFHRAALLAQDAKDVDAHFVARARLFELLATRTIDADALAPLLAELRSLALRTGDLHSVAELHLYVASMEANRGLFSNALRHTRIVKEITRDKPNVYLDAYRENLEFGICIVLADHDGARVHGMAALSLAEKAGRKTVLRAILGNLGSWYYEVGEFDRANEYLARVASREFGHGSIHARGAAEGLSRLRLSEGRLDECRVLLDTIDATAEPHRSYIFREAQLTRARLVAKQGDADEALRLTAKALALADEAGDQFLRKRALLQQAELLADLGRVQEARERLMRVVPSLVNDSPDLFAYAEQTFACARIREQDPLGAASHRQRAVRISRTTGSVAGRQILDEQWARAGGTDADRHANQSDDSPESRRATGRTIQRTLHAVAAILAHSGRPRIAAEELRELLIASGAVQRATVQSSAPGETQTSSPDLFLEVGRQNDQRISVAVCPDSDMESAATTASAQIIVNAVQELARARSEREEHATLWPIEELPTEEGTVVTGYMRELMTFVRRIARTTVNVLITGESGTGKEIAARAIHNSSDRADRPFVAFNCSAIPRDLLESQLFGHRRGAFTGADRDHLGLIRSARGGTLFLDEIGELSLEAQPKLLRFLESGEIGTLGELQPQKSDVRIIAATNANVEEAVRTGRFREDLFYRLNVVRLSLNPLRERRDEIPSLVHHFVARASEEFRKGRILVSDDAMERLLLYRWPGNIRQLQNEIRRMVALADPDSTLTPSAIHPEILGADSVVRHDGINGSELSIPLRAKLTPTLARIECEMIRAALKDHGGKVNVAAKALGISRKGLYLKRQRFGL